jgi:hypothetical protein
LSRRRIEPPLPKLVVEHDGTSALPIQFGVYQCEMPGAPFSTTRDRLPDLRSPKTVYDELNTSEPTLKDGFFVAIVVSQLFV